MSEYPAQDLADSEKIFEESKRARMLAKHKWEAAKGRYHNSLTVRREAGKKLTIADIRALEAVAIEDVDFVRDAYVAFIAADSHYRASKVNYETDKRAYWDGKEIKPGGHK